MRKKLFALNKKDGILLLIATIVSLLIHIVISSSVPILGIIHWGFQSKNNQWDYLPIYTNDLIGILIIFLLTRVLLKINFQMSFKSLTKIFYYGWSVLPIIGYNFLYLEHSKITDFETGQILFIALFSFISALMIGFFEELIFRGGILMGLKSIFPNHKLAVILSSSVIFGLVHLSNLGAQSFWDTMNQVYMAFAVGVLFSVIFLVSENLFIPIILHTVVDTTDLFTSFFYKGSESSGFSWIIFTFSLLYLISAYYLYKKEFSNNKLI